MAPLRVNNRAQADLANIWLYVANDSLDAADRLLDKIQAAFVSIAAHPGIGTPRAELGRRVRAFSVGAYVVYFRTVEEGVEIIRVMHGARNVTDLEKLD